MRRERYTAFFRDELHVRELEPLGVLDQLTEVVVNCGPFVNQSPPRPARRQRMTYK
jgi:hypothetical protein